MKELCRLCGKTKCTVINIFSPEASKLLLMKITTSINIYLSETDPFPKTVCTLCLGKLDYICEFQDMCRRTQIFFRKVLMVAHNKTSDDLKNILHKNPESTQNCLIKRKKSLGKDLKQTSQKKQSYSSGEVQRTDPYSSDHSQMILNRHPNQATYQMCSDNKFMMCSNAHSINDPLVVTGPTLPQNYDPAVLISVSQPHNYTVYQKNDLSSKASVLSNLEIPAEQYSSLNTPIASSFSRIPVIVTDPNKSVKSVSSNIKTPFTSQHFSLSPPVQHKPLPSCISPEVVKTSPASRDVDSHCASLLLGVTSNESGETLSSSASLISLTPFDLSSPLNNDSSLNKKMGRRRTWDSSLRHNGESRDVPTENVSDSSACQTESSILLQSETIITSTLQQTSIPKSDVPSCTIASAVSVSALQRSVDVMPRNHTSSTVDGFRLVWNSDFLSPCTIAPAENVSALQRFVDVMTRNYNFSTVDIPHGSSVRKSNLFPPFTNKTEMEFFSTLPTSVELTTRNQKYSSAEIVGDTYEVPNDSSTHETNSEPLNLMEPTYIAVSTPDSGSTGIVVVPLEKSPTLQSSVAPSKCVSTTITRSTVLSGAADDVPSTLQATESVQKANPVSTFESSVTNELRMEFSTTRADLKDVSSINAELTVVSDVSGELPSNFQLVLADVDFVTTLDHVHVKKSNTQTTVESHVGDIPAQIGLSNSLASLTCAVSEQSSSRPATLSKSTVEASSISTDDNIEDGDSGCQENPVGDTFESGESDLECIYPETLQCFLQRIQQLARGTAQLVLLPKCCPSCSCLKILLVDHSSFYCRNCNQIFDLHQKDFVGNLYYECSTCKQNFAHYSELCQHNKIHKTDRFSCVFCNMGFTNKNNFSEHIRSVHLSNKLIKSTIGNYKSSKCDKIFANKTSFTYHLVKSTLEHTGKDEAHTNKDIFCCDFCGKELSTKVTLLAHMKTFHLNLRNHKCSVCDKSFSRMNKLKEHMKLHETPSYLCSICGISKHTKDNLGRHIFLTHSTERPHKCNECDGAFKTKSLLKLHQMVHTGEKPLCCEQCGKSFARQFTLDIHKKCMHMPKSIKCPLCSNMFSHKSNLKTHLNAHAKLKKTFLQKEFK